MELRHLRYLIAVAEEKSFVAAAARLQLAQPALSRQIRDLEQEIGTELFIRESSGTRLSAAGEECLRTARQIVDEMKAAMQRARLADHGLVGRCVIGAGRTVLWNGLLARVVEEAHKDYPGIDVVVQEFSSLDQWKALGKAEVDIAIGSAPAADSQQFAVETHSLDVLDSVVVSRSHPLAAREKVTLRDLATETWVRYAPAIEDEATRSLQQVLMRLGLSPESRRLAANTDAVRMLVRSGAGWTALPRSLQHNLNSGLVALPVEDLSVPFRYVYMQRRGDERPVVRSILRSIRRTGQREATVAETPAGIRAAPSHAADQIAYASRVELRHLRYFTATVQYESIGRAAEALQLTQPALSRQLRDLEAEVGVPLLTRNARGVVPTLAGEALNRDALAILRAADRLSSEAHRAVRGTAGDCVVGVVSSPLVWETVTHAVADIASRLPFVDVHVEDVPTPRQASALREARVDVAIGHRYPSAPDLDPNVIRSLLLPDSMNQALLSQNHPLAHQPSVSLADLRALPFLFMRREFSPQLYDFVMSTFTRAGFSPRIDGEYDGLPTVWALAAQGLGWCLGMESQHTYAPNGLVAVPIRDCQIPWGVELVYRSDESRPPVLEVIGSLRQAALDIREGMASQENKYWSDVSVTA